MVADGLGGDAESPGERLARLRRAQEQVAKLVDAWDNADRVSCSDAAGLVSVDVDARGRVVQVRFIGAHRHRVSADHLGDAIVAAARQARNKRMRTWTEYADTVEWTQGPDSPHETPAPAPAPPPSSEATARRVRVLLASVAEIDTYLDGLRDAAERQPPGSVSDGDNAVRVVVDADGSSRQVSIDSRFASHASDLMLQRRVEASLAAAYARLDRIARRPGANAEDLDAFLRRTGLA